MNTDLNATHGIVKGHKEKLMNDLNLVVADVEDLLKKVANSTTERFSEARTKIERKLGEARSRLDDVRIAVTEKARHSAGATQEYVRENPWKSIGVAAAAGLIIGFLLRRR